MNETLIDDRPEQLDAAQDQAQESGKRKRRPTDAAREADAALESLRRGALEPGETRDHLYENHPLTKNEVAVATPPLKAAYEVIQDVVVHRDSGTCLLAAFRVGKTTAIEAAVLELTRTFPNLPVGIAFAKAHDAFTQGVYFSDLLQDFGHAGALRGTAQEKRLRVLNMFITQARQFGSDRYLLLVDEGQNWGEAQLTWLRDLANDLQAKQVRLITVTFGQTTEMLALRERLLSRARTDLIGRFLLTPREFHGIRNLEELYETLAAYDDPNQSEYPLQSGISYTEFFMPMAWKSGWRLAKEAGAMWTELRAVAARKNQSQCNIGMNWIGGAIRNFLFSQLPHDGAGFAGTPELWAHAVQASGYESTLF